MARSRDIEYRVGFTGDTSQLEAAVKKATESLTKLGTSPEALRKGMDGAARSALELSNHLNAAFNQNTGKLDLIKFQQQLNASGKDIEKYAADLRSLGPEGQQAFLDMASAIGKAELPLRRTNTLIKQFGVTLWNTARWRITTGAINAIVGGMQQAVGYAKSLDASLNNIRIVTGKSAEEMAAFAKEANNAAKTLSTTTTAYTDASLIYYQQGLGADAVRERTEATIKMANVTGQSAETISSQMTAIWENFDDGSRSLESFGDSMVALGASTAASSKEIAEGLQKFAPIAQTVGLSFDYASAALTTIVANTRESASVAGTALKTLFSRLEGLKLGETLDDGTDLNKYSNALMAVGVNIKDVNGELKDMDTILDELGGKWQSLSKDQQLALAETVGGVRQYAQLVALMDNWGDFQKNLLTSQTAEGELQKQADIYAESWEAARNRVKAATEDIYDSLINADQFVKLDDLFTPILTGVASAIDAIGGLTGMLPLVVLLMNKAFGDKIAQSLRDMTVNIGLMTGAEQKRARALQASFAAEADLLGIGMEENTIASAKVEILKEEVGLQAEINSKIDQMPTAQREALNNELQLVEVLKEEALRTAEIAEARQVAVENAQLDILSGASNSRNIQDVNQLFGNHQIAGNHFIDSDAIKFTNDFDDAVKNLTEQLQKSVSASVTAQNHIKSLNKDFKDNQKAANEAAEASRAFLKSVGQPIKSDASIQDIISKLREVKNEAVNARGALRAALTNLDINPSQINTFVAAVARLTEAGMDATTALELMKNGVAKTEEIISASKVAYVDWADALVKVGSYASQAAMAIRAIGNLKDIFSKDSELSSSEKWSQGLMSIAMIAPLAGKGITPIVKGFKNLHTVTEDVTAQIPLLTQAQNAAKIAHQQASASLENYINNFGVYGTQLDKVRNKVKVAYETEVAASQAVVQAEQQVKAARAAAWSTVGITAAIAIIVAAIGILIKKYQEEQEAIRKANQERVEAAEKTKEEIAENQKLIDSYEAALKIYNENHDEKDKLIETTEALAEAYGHEGLALAKLTGDYSNFTERVKEAQRKQLLEQKEILIEGIQGTLGLKTNNKKFNRQFSFEVSTDDSSRMTELGLGKYLEEYSDVQDQIRAVPETLEDLLEMRKAYSNALKKLEEQGDDFGSTTDPEAIKKSLEKGLKGYNELISLFQDDLTKLATIDIQLAGVSEEFADFQGYKSWIEKSKELVSSYSLTDSSMNEAIRTAALNLNLDEWIQIQDIVEDITAEFERHPAILEKVNKYLDQVKTLEDAEIAAYLPWSAVDDSNLDKLIDNTKKYVKALQSGAQAAVDLATGQKLLNKIGSEFKVKDLEEYANFLKTIGLDFEAFLSMNEGEQRKAVNEGIEAQYQQQQSQYQEQLDALRANKREAKNKQQSAQLIYDYEQSKGIGTSLEDYTDIQDDWSDIKGFASIYEKQYLEAIAKTSESEKEEALENAEKQLRESLEKVTTLDDQKESLVSGIIGTEGDYLKAANVIKEIFSSLINDPIIARLLTSQDDLDTIQGLIDDVTETVDNNRIAWEAQDVSTAKSSKTIGELNKNLREGSVRSLKAYSAGIVELAKQTPKATDALKRYNEALAKGKDGEEDAAAALREMASAIELTAWSDAIPKIKKVQEELAKTGSSIGDPSQKINIAEYQEKIKEIAKILSETMGQEIDARWVEEKADLINKFITESDAKTLATAISAPFRMANYIATDSFAEFLETLELDENQIAAIIKGLDGLDFDINGYANVASLLSDLAGVEVKAADVYRVLQHLSTVDIGFSFSGGDISDIGNMPLPTDFGQNKRGQLEYQQALKKWQNSLNMSFRSTSTLDDKIPYGPTGGGGGSSKKDAKDLKKDLKDVEDRYHEINRQLERQQRILTELDKQISRTYGTGRLKLYQQQLAEIQKNINLLTQKSAEASGYLKEDKAVLEGIVTDDKLDVKLFEGIDVQFGVGQEVENYNAVLEQIVALYNAFIEKYEAAIEAGDSALVEELEKQKKIEDKLYEARMDALAKYEDSLDQVNTLKHQIDDELRKQEDIKLNEITYKMKLVLDVRDAKKQINDFSKTIEESFGDALTHTAKSVLFDEANAKEEMAMYTHYVEEYEALKQRLAEANEFTDTDAIIEELKALEDHIIESGEALLEWLDTVENMFANALKAAAERFDWFVDKVSHDTEMLGLVKELYALQGITYKTQEGFEKLQATQEGQYQGYLRQAQLNKQWYEDRAAELAKAEAALAGVDESDVAYDTLKKNRDALLDEVNRAQQAMLENSKLAMETARQMYLDEVDRMSYELEQRLTNGLGFDLLEDKYNHFLEESDRYLDPIEEGLETASWYTKLQKDVDKTSNTVYKDRLKALQEEIDLRRENNTLSKYDLDLLEAKYQVLQAEMALEDARNNKNQLRLVRDSNGNWNYQYTANPDDLATQEEDLLKAKQNEYEITKNRYKELNDEMLRMAREFAEADKQIRQDMANGILTEEEGAARLKELEEYYTKKAELLTAELEIARDDMSEAAVTSSVLAAGLSESVYETSSETIKAIVDSLKEDGGPALIAAAGSIFSVLQDSLRENLVDKFGQTSQEIQNHIRDIVSGENVVGTLEWLTKSFVTGMESIVNSIEDNFIPAIKDYIPQARDIFDDFQQKIKQTAAAIGVDPDSLSNMTQNLTDDIEDLYQQGTAAIDMMDKQLDAIMRLQEEYLAWADTVMEVVRAMEELARAQAATIESAAGLDNDWGGQSDNDNDDNPTPDNPTPNNPTPEEPTRGNWPPSSGDTVSWTGVAPNRVFTVNGQSYRWGSEEADLLQRRLNQRIAEGAVDWNSQTFRFKTGGYTGEWGDSSGKFALLHQKELVLNEDDTANILEAVHVMRTISDTVFNGIAKSLDSAGAASMVALGSRLGGIGAPAASMQIEQHVTIEQVNFPGVTSSREIEEAFESLVNDAAQWARRRKS